MITQERVKELFEYRDGKLYWRKSVGAKIRGGERAGSRLKEIYWKIAYNKIYYQEHRLIFLMFHGWLPKELDHISDELTDEGIKSNSIENLQPIEHGSNVQKTAFVRGISRYRGVSKSKTINKWIARIRKHNHWFHLGTFYDEKSAARAYDSAAMRMYGEHCFLNFPGGE